MKRFIVSLVILLVLASILAGCGGTATTTATPTATATATATATTTTTTAAPIVNKFGGTLRMIEIQAPGAPLGAEWEGNLNTYDTQQWCEERMLREQKDGSMAGELAETWEVNTTAGNASILFHLRKGVTFHDGTPWNAAAAAWNIDMYKKGNMFGGTTNYWKSWDIIDDYTLRVNMTSWTNTLLRAWENYFIVSPTAYDVHGIAWMRTNMVGTGPFIQTDYQKDVSFTAIRNPNYWRKDADGNKLPYLDKVQLLYVADETQRENLMKSGGAEILTSNTKQASRFDAAQYNIITRSGGCTMLLPDGKNAASPFNDINVRLALEYAIDRETLAKSFGYGFDKPAYEMASPAFAAYDPNLKPRMFSVDTAKSYLAKSANFSAGFSTTMYVGPGLNRDPVVAIQSMLAKININVDLQFPEPAAWQTITTTPLKTNSILYIAYPEFSNYNTTLNVVFSLAGFYYPSVLRPSTYTDLFTKSLAAPTPDPVILKQIIDAYFDTASVCPLVYATAIYIQTLNVMDSKITQYGSMVVAMDYSGLWLKK